jgi:GntR family transcriptional regulator of vanillate catabolism
MPPKTPKAPGSQIAAMKTAAPESSQTARVTLALREMLLEGRFQPGERIREVPLAAELGVSRIPLRLVLAGLAHEGFLAIRPTRGFVVEHFTRADICEAIELRGLLEGMAARMAAERISDIQDVAPLEAINNELAVLVRGRKPTAGYLEAYIQLNAKFHEEILRLASCKILDRAMQHTCTLPFASPSAFVKRQYIAAESRELFQVAVDQHQVIVEAIGNRESGRAETLAREHARLARRNLETALRHGEIAKFVPGMKLVKL